MNKAYVYCKENVDKDHTPKYVKLQMKEFMEICEGKSKKYIVSDKKVKQVENILKLLVMPKGLKAGQTLYECTVGYQWLVYISMLCVVHKDTGKRRYERGVLEIARKNYKALALDTPIPTPSGWKTMGQISVGDYVFAKNGKPTMVIGESEIFNKPMYEVEFEDGEIIKASEDHIWTVQTKNSRRSARRKKVCTDGRGFPRRYDYEKRNGWYELTTKDMINDFVRIRPDGKGNEYKYRVPMNKAVEYTKKELSLDPYLLGVWLGDGTSIRTNITTSLEDKDEMMDLIKKSSGYSVEYHYEKEKTGYIKVDKQKNNKTTKDNFIYKLRELNLINNKHIPLEYLQSSVEQRLALLQGLMDTDGSCAKNGQCSFVQKSKILSEQVLELINSLGIKAKMIQRKSIFNGKKISDIYNITFFVDKNVPVFRLRRKYERQKEKLAERMESKSIIDIRQIENTPSKCIMVADKEHLYLAGKHFTPTHNTFTIATLFIILFLTEPKFSQFFSVAADSSLSKMVRNAIEEILKESPMVYEYNGEKRFAIRRDYIKFLLTQSTYIPLSFSISRLDGRMPNVWLADEVGALPTNYPIEAMEKGQIGVNNKLGFIISTKYNTIDNPFEEEVNYSKKVLDGIENDETRFSLLYEPDTTKGWETDDLILKQANPVALEVPEIWQDLLKLRASAIAMENKREEFLTKNCNIIYQGQGTETYIDVKELQECKVANIDWKGRVVYIGLDLSETIDNTSVAMVAVDEDDNILTESWAFIPEGRIEEKTLTEKVNYRELINTGKVIACGDKVIDYGVVEDFILSLEDKYGVKIQAIAYDRRNAISTINRLEKEGYNAIEVKQHSSVLHSPFKLMREKVLNKEVKYTENKILEINFQNAKLTYDTNLNYYVNKKRSRGKVDMVFALVNAVCLLEQDCFLNKMDWTVQVI